VGGMMFKEILKNVRENGSFVHSITNYVTVNDCANIILACGGSPIMADDILEVEEITSLCNALVINIGTLNERSIDSMIIAGKKANELKHPVILDPVGIGASRLRTDTALRLFKEVNFTVIRGNASEIKAIDNGIGNTKGVDADASDFITEDNLDATLTFAKRLSERMNSVIVITGAIDIVADGRKAYVIRNGHPMMSKITGTGCMLTALIGAYCGANPEKPVDASAAAVCSMGICGELAYKRITENDEGTASFRVHLIDYISKLNKDLLARYTKAEVR
jgi:hydroxyethylthiazole kinase